MAAAPKYSLGAPGDEYRAVVNSRTGERFVFDPFSKQWGRDPYYIHTPPEEPAPQAPQDPLETGVELADFGKSIMAGGASLAQGVGWLMKIAPLGEYADNVGGAIEELGANAVDYWNEGLSEAAKTELSKEFIRKNEMGEYEWGDAGLTTVGLYGAQSLLGTAAGAGVGAGVTKVLQAFANPVGRSLLAKAAAEGSMQAAKKLRLVDSVIGAAGFGVGEGAVSGASIGANVYSMVMKMDPEKLATNDRYQQVFGSTDEAMPWLERHQYAAEAVAREASSMAGFQSGLTTALLGAPLGAYFGTLLGRSAMGKLAQSRATAALVGAAGEAGQEALQSGAESISTNIALQGAGDKDRGTFEDTLNQMLGGGLAGGVIGGPFAAGAFQRPAQSAKSGGKPAPVGVPPAGAPPTKPTEILAGVARSAREAGVDDKEILGTVRQVLDKTADFLPAVTKLRKLAEAARTGAVDKRESTGYPQDTKEGEAATPAAGPAAVPERVESPRPVEPAEPVKPESRATAAPKPASQPPAMGARQQTRAGPMEVETQYRVYELRDLIPSHTMEGTPRPDYPQARQPRDRSRPASRQWLADAAANFRPEGLVRPSDNASGTPIVDQNRIVGSGNGRVLLLQQAHAMGKGAQYTNELKAKAQQFGIDPAEIDRFQQPVLVREETQPMSVEQEVAFAREANRPGMAQFSPSELARADAGQLTDLDLQAFNPSGEGDVLAASNDQFIRRFMGRMPAAERGAMMTAEGRPTKQLADRVRLAVFQRAYQDERILNLVAEEADPEFRNVLSALTTAAPAWAKARAADPTLGQYDVVQPLMQAVDVLRQAKAKGQAVDEYLRQQGLFAQLDPLAERMAQFLQSNLRSSKRMGEALSELGSRVETALSRQGTNDIFGEAPPTLEQLLNAVNQQVVGRHERPAGQAQSMLFSRSGTVTDQIPDNELYGGDPSAPPRSSDAPDFGRPEAPPQTERSNIPQNIPQGVKADLLAAMGEENRPIAEDLMERVRGAADARGKHSVDVKSRKSLLGKANRPSILALKPWWNVEYVSDSFRFKLVLDNFSQLPDVLKVFTRESNRLGIEVVKADFSKFWSQRALGPIKLTKEQALAAAPVDLWGWRMVPIDLRMPNGQLSEFYVTVREMDDAQAATGHDLFERWRYRDARQVLSNRATREAYLRDLSLSRDAYDGAMRSYLTRTNQSLSALLASFTRAEAAASSMGAKSFRRSSSVPEISPVPSAQTPAGSRVATKSAATTTTRPEPSRADITEGRTTSAMVTPTADSLPESPQSVPAFSRGAAGGQLAAAVRAELGPALDALTGIVDVRIAQSVKDVEAATRSFVPGDVEGAYVGDGRTVWLVADNLPAGRAPRVLVHEVFGHLAMERYPEFDRALNMVRSLYGMKNRAIVQLWNEVARKDPQLSRVEHSKEVIALMAERGVKHSALDRMMAAVRDFVRRLGFTIDYSEAELRALIVRASRAFFDVAQQRGAPQPSLAALTPRSTDAEILAAINTSYGAEVEQDLTTQLQNDIAAINNDSRTGHALDDTLATQRAELQAALDASYEREDFLDRTSALRSPGAVEAHRAAMMFSRAATPDPATQAAMDAVMAPAPESVTLLDRLRRTWQQIRNVDSLKVKQGLIDSFASVEALEREFTGGSLLDATQSAHKMALATKNLPSVMAAIMKVGVPDYVDGVYQPVKGRKGVMEIFEPLWKHPDGNLLRQWEFYAAARRADRLIQEKNPDGTSREKLFTPDQIATGLALEAKYPEFKQVFEDWQTFNKQALDMAEAAGIVDPVARAQWERNDYVPFYRAMDEVSGVEGPRTRRSVANQKADIRRLRGGEAKLGNVFENMMLNTAHLVDASFKNRAMQRIVGLGYGEAIVPISLEAEAVKISDDQLARALTAAGLVVGNSQTDPFGVTVVKGMTAAQKAHWSTLFRRVAPKGPNVVTVMQGGKPEYYEITDPLLLSAVAGLGHETFSDIFGLFRGSKKLLTNAVTADPAFMLANFVRDTLSNWVTSDASAVPVIGAIKGLKATWSEDGTLMALMMAGAGGGGYYDANPEDIRKLVATKVSAAEVSGFLQSIVTPKNVWRVWRKIGAAAENANRVATFKAVQDNGGSVAEAAYQARDVLNFSMRGDFAAMRWLTQTVPFMNARIQGLYRLYRGARDNPTSFALKGMVLLAATMALAAANNDREEYEELPEWDKDLYWHFFVDGEHYRLPKPFEVGAMFATVPERAWRALTGRDSGKILWQRVVQMTADTFAMNPVPQLVKPLIEQYANRSMFTGSRIVGMAEAQLKPEAQFTPWTSETMRELADLMPDWMPEWARSPRRLEAGLRAYTGSVGMYLLSIGDAITRGAAGYPDVPSRKLYDYPVVSRFWKDPNPRHTKYADQMYEYLDEANALYSTINRFRKEARFEEAKELLRENRGKLAVRQRLNAIATQTRNLNNQIRLIQLSKTMDAEEKRRRIDALNDRKNKIVAQVGRFADLF